MFFASKSESGYVFISTVNVVSNNNNNNNNTIY